MDILVSLSYGWNKSGIDNFIAVPGVFKSDLHLRYRNSVFLRFFAVVLSQYYPAPHNTNDNIINNDGYVDAAIS